MSRKISPIRIDKRAFQRIYELRRNIVFGKYMYLPRREKGAVLTGICGPRR